MQNAKCRQNDHEFFLGTPPTENSGSLEDAPAAPRNVKAATQPPDSFFQLMPDEAGKRTEPNQTRIRILL